MAKVFKKSITRYLDHAGRQVKKGTPGARKSREKSAKWYGRVPGDPRDVPLSTNKSAAQIMLNELVRKAELAKAGIHDPFEGGAAQAPAPRAPRRLRTGSEPSSAFCGEGEVSLAKAEVGSALGGGAAGCLLAAGGGCGCGGHGREAAGGVLTTEATRSGQEKGGVSGGD